MGKENSFKSFTNGSSVGDMMSIFGLFRIFLGRLILRTLWCQVQEAFLYHSLIIKAVQLVHFLLKCHFVLQLDLHLP